MEGAVICHNPLIAKSWNEPGPSAGGTGSIGGPRSRGLPFLPERHKLLGRGRVDGDGPVELGLGRPQRDRDTDRLDQFARTRSHQVNAENAVALAIRSEEHT